MQVTGCVIVRIGFGRRYAKTGSRADEGLVNLVPEGARPHEGLVIEPGGKQHVKAVIDRADIKFQAGIFVLAVGFKPVPDFLHGCARVGLKLSLAAACSDQGVRFF